MVDKEFVELVKSACACDGLPSALAYFQDCDDENVAQTAQELKGQFAVAEIDGEQRIYHVMTETDDEGNEQEYADHVMNEGDDTIRFVAWFFDVFFAIKQKDVYQAAGKTYRQPKRS
jgi:hypothetical protein